MNCALVLLPGMDGTGELFAPLIEALHGDVQTIIVRYPDRPLDYVEHTEFARERLPQDRPYVVLGESFSGPVAVALAASAPAGMSGYVLGASFVRTPRTVLRVLRPLLGVLPARGVPSAIAAHFLMGRFATESLRRAHVTTLRSVSSRALTARLQAIAAIDVRDDLSRVRMPGLYLRATEDRLVPRAASIEFQRLAPDGRVVDIEGPHFLLQINPGAAARALRSFLVQAAARNRQVT
jgi:pimeloyl-ACP methyl ester carboxylesterase